MVTERAIYHTVVEGESLGSIAKHHLGAYADWPKLREWNKDQIKNADLIYPGQRLIVGWERKETHLIDDSDIALELGLDN